VSYENFLSLLRVASPRVNLEIDNVRVFDLVGAEEARKEAGFIE